ncbi:MAG: hypothetical protein ACR2IF_13250 [Terriglobales bacterium]
MRTVKIVVGVLTVLLIVILSGLNMKRSGDSTVYAASNEIKLSGTVQDVQEYFCPVTDDRGTHLLLDLGGGETTVVHVAVGRFLRENRVAFSPGQRIQVIGAKIRINGKDAVIAREITRGNEVITLRNAQGKPLWTN